MEHMMDRDIRSSMGNISVVTRSMRRIGIPRPFCFSFVYREEPPRRRITVILQRLYFPLCIHGCKTTITRIGHWMRLTRSDELDSSTRDKTRMGAEGPRPNVWLERLTTIRLSNHRVRRYASVVPSSKTSFILRPRFPKTSSSSYIEGRTNSLAASSESDPCVVEGRHAHTILMTGLVDFET